MTEYFASDRQDEEKNHCKWPLLNTLVGLNSKSYYGLVMGSSVTLKDLTEVGKSKPADLQSLARY